MPAGEIRDKVTSLVDGAEREAIVFYCEKCASPLGPDVDDAQELTLFVVFRIEGQDHPHIQCPICNTSYCTKAGGCPAEMKQLDVAIDEAAKTQPSILLSAEDLLARQMLPVRYDEPTCIQCGCTNSKPCTDGAGIIMGSGGTCSWRLLDSRTNAGLCSRCA